MIFGERDLTQDDVGRTQVRRVFAWLPKRTVNGQRVWLERVIQSRVCELRYPHQYAVFMHLKYPGWSSWRTYTVEQFAEAPLEPVNATDQGWTP